MILNNKKVLVTGGTGSLGHAIVKYLFLNHRPSRVIIYSRDEFKQSEMAKKFACDKYDGLRFFLGDVRDYDRLCQAFSGIDYVIHAAALKQVPTLEYNPEEAVKTNVNGSMNVIKACIECGVDKAILISTDKAVSPINLYGATKLCAEKLFMAANAYNKTQFSCVRYGNVIGSRGSVIPLFQKLKDKPFPITSKEMTRFWITIEDAVRLIVTAIKYHESGIFVPVIPSMSMVDVARAVDENREIKIIGVRAGEKIHESLVSQDNANVFLVDTAICKAESDFVYTSDKARKMTIEEMRERIRK